MMPVVVMNEALILFFKRNEKMIKIRRTIVSTRIRGKNNSLIDMKSKLKENIIKIGIDENKNG